MAASFSLEKIQSLLHEKGIYSKLAEEWDHFGSTVDVPQSKRDEIRHSLHMDNGARLGSIFEYLVSMHPYGSWRLLIWALDEMGTNYKHYADAIRDSAEPVERSLIKDEVLAILKKSSLLRSHAKLDHLANILLVPSSQKGESFKTVSERAEVVVEYWCNTLYNASWATLAGALFYLAEKKELVDEVKMKIQSIPHSTSIVIVCDDLEAAARSILKDSEELCKMLNIPHKAGTVDTRFVPDAEIEAKKKKMFEVYISSHPSPSWRQFALSLYRLKEHDSLKSLYNSQLPGPDKLRNYDAYQRALETEDNYDIIVMQGVMTGFPRSGKTSLMAKLTHKAIESDPLSTGVAERVELINMTQPIAAEEEDPVFRKTTPGAVSVTRQMHWRSTSMGQEIATALKQIASSTRPSNTDSRPANPPPLASPTATEARTLAADPSPPVEKKAKGHRRRSSSIANFLKVSVLKRIRKKAVVTAPPAATPSGVPPSHLLLAKGMESDAVSEVLWTLYLSDVGGQPEFQELLAAVVSGPTMFFVVFPLHLPLDHLYRINHLDTGNAKMKPYQSSLTMREAILQSLASITSTAIIREGKRVLPKILFVGTHKDKLNRATQLDDIGKIDQDLFQMVKETEAYNMDVIIRASQSQMIFTVDNTESSEHPDFQQIRTTIQKIGLENNSIYKVSIPGSWMLLALYLRYRVERDGLQVYSYDECFEDAQDLGIKSKDDLNGALWFFHYHLGIVRHYQEIPELRHRIIADSQHIFDRVTTVIKKTFSYTDKAGSTTKLEKKGIFSRDALIKHLSTQSQDITPQELLALLEYLYITAKLEQRGKQCEYFLPCALQHAPKPQDNAKEEPQDSLLFTFTCGFCPRGIFGALVVHVLKRMENLEYEWNLDKDTIFRNQFSMKIGPHRDIFQFTLLPKYIRIDVYPSKLKVRAVPLSRVCCHVRSEMEHGLETVSCKLSYNGSKSQPTFLCPHSHAGPHPVETAFYKGVPSVLDCNIHEDVRQREVDKKHLIWFPSGEKKTPSVKELTENLISVAHKWEELAVQLEVPEDIRSDINDTGSSSREKLYKLLELWCKQGESLQKIVEALKSELMSEQALAAKFQETYNIP